MLGEFFNAFELFDHVFGQHAFLDARDIGRYGLRNPGQFVSVLAELGQIVVRLLRGRGRDALSACCAA